MNKILVYIGKLKDSPKVWNMFAPGATDFSSYVIGALTGLL